jgi:hypothetical protein
MAISGLFKLSPKASMVVQKTHPDRGRSDTLETESVIQWLDFAGIWS